MPAALAALLLLTPADPPADPVAPAASLTIDDSHLLVPVCNLDDRGERVRLELRDGGRVVQAFDVTLPKDGAPFWTTAYPLDHFDVRGDTLTLRVKGGTVPAAVAAAFESIRVGPESAGREPGDWTEPYRNRFHLAAPRGWNNDPNGLVFHDGLWHVFYQHNPFGIVWGNMHWGHDTSPDLVNWTERPIALFQNGPDDAMFSGGGFVDSDDSAGLGAGTLFVAFTSTGRGECLAYSRDGVTFEELPENPVVTHDGRDPKVFRHGPTGRWVMAVYEEEDTPTVRATPPGDAEPDFKPLAQVAFYVSEDLRTWERTGAFTSPDRRSVYECPELFELPVLGGNGEPTGESKWVLYAGSNEYHLGRFDGRSFTAESGPHGGDHGAIYASQNFSSAPGGRAIRVSWVRTPAYIDRFPAQTVNQCLSLPHELTLHVTPDGPRLRYRPVAELIGLREETAFAAKNLSADEAAAALREHAGGPIEVEIAFADDGPHDLTIAGVDAAFSGRSARIYVDRTVTEIYADDGRSYRVSVRSPDRFGADESAVGGPVASLTVHRLKSFWPPKTPE